MSEDASVAPSEKPSHIKWASFVHELLKILQSLEMTFERIIDGVYPELVIRESKCINLDHLNRCSDPQTRWEVRPLM